MWWVWWVDVEGFYFFILDLAGDCWLVAAMVGGCGKGGCGCGGCGMGGCGRGGCVEVFYFYYIRY